MTPPAEQPGEPSTSEEHPQLYAEQVRLLYKNAVAGLTATLINSAILVFILRSNVPNRVLTTWLVCILVVSTGRFAQFMKFRRLPGDSSDVGHWGTWFIVGMTLSGIVWGAAGVFLFPVESIIHQAFLAFVLGGMAIGAAGAFSVVLPAFMAFVLPSLAPLIIRFLAAGDETHLAMGAMCLLFFVLTTGIAVHINRGTAASFRLRFENSSLISYLSSAKDDLEKLNRELSSEILERRKAEEELKRHRDHLEELVDNRTAELKATNTILQQEISERKKIEDVLRDSERLLRESQEAARIGSYALDVKSGIWRSSEVLDGLLGIGKEYPHDIGGWVSLIHPDHREHMAEYFTEEVIRKKQRFDRQYKIMRQTDHEERWVQWLGDLEFDEEGDVIRMVGTIQDITEQKKMEAEILKAQKIESIGILAGGIAHDFNNLLQAILGNISLAKMLTTPHSRIFPLLEESENASEQARELSYQLLTFSKGGSPVKRLVSIGILLKEAVTLSLSGSNVTYELNLPEGLDLLEVDEGQIKQVFYNLLINAKEAMPEGGKVRISAVNVRVEGSDNLPLKEGKHVRISIADHGVGIPDGNIPKIFDPYFSTKKRGSDKGMGLGLAICHSIISKHEGHITVESEVGVGTTFHIYLPSSPLSIIQEITGKDGSLFAGRGRVLLMDDDERVRRIAGAMLQQLGYDVDCARNGEEAIERYRRGKDSGKRIDAVILDLTVPGGMGGEKALRKLREIDPELKAVISSGYADDPVMKDFRAFGFLGAIAKPYTIAKLAALLGKLEREI